MFSSAKAQRRASDTIWRIKWRDQDLHICIIFEFQSSVDRFMAVRWMVYIGMLYQLLIDSGLIKPRGKLPPVLPILIYNGKPKWTAPEELCDLIEETPGFEEFIPRLRYLTIDERRLDPAMLAAMPNRAAVLFQLEQCDTVEEVVGLIGRVLELAPIGHSLRRAFHSWLRQVVVPSLAGEVDVPEVEDLGEFRAMLAESVIEWREGWKKEGHDQGVKQGEETLFLLLMEERFGLLPQPMIARIKAADAEQLLEWGKRFVYAATLDDVFGPIH